MKKYWFVFSLLVLWISACQQDEEISSPATNKTAFEDGFFIINEGGFTNNNASIDFYEYATDSLHKDLYLNQNQEQLGDIFQSAYKVGSDYYLTINNSGKIVQTDSLLNKVSSIDDLSSPRYMAFYGGKAFISDLYADLVHVADLSSNTLVNSIQMDSWTEGITTKDSFVIVCLPQEDEVRLIHAPTETTIDTLSITGGPSAILSDSEGYLWVLGSGNYQGTIFPSLSKIEIQEDKLNIVFSESINGVTGYFPSICYNPLANELYIALGQSIFRQEATSNGLDLALLFDSDAINIYGINFNPNHNEILLSDAIDYAQQGIIFRYDLEGNKLSSFKAGLIPNGFLIHQ